MSVDMKGVKGVCAFYRQGVRERERQRKRKREGD